MRLNVGKFSQLSVRKIEMTYFRMKVLITLTIFGTFQFTVSTDVDTTATLNGNFIKPIKNNGNTIKPVKNNVNNVYNVYVEQHHLADNEEEKGDKDVGKKIEILGTAGLVSEGSEIFCPN